MKTKILLIVIVLSGAGVFGFVQSRKMSKTSTQYSQWITSATSLSQSFDKATAGRFLKKKTVKHIGLNEFPAFSRDTLYVRFDKDFVVEAYNDGILITSFGFSDTINAISLLYGIARHTIQCNPVNYGVLQAKHLEIDHVRGLQYTFDVMRQISKPDYRKLIEVEKERVRHLEEYKMMDSTQIAKTNSALILQRNFGHTTSWHDKTLRNLFLHLAASFDVCDQIHGDSDESWECKINIYDKVFYEFSSANIRVN